MEKFKVAKSGKNAKGFWALINKSQGGAMLTAFISTEKLTPVGKLLELDDSMIRWSY